MQAWLGARLTMVDPKQYPTFDELLEPKAEASESGVDQELLRRLTALHMAQQAKAEAAEREGADRGDQ